MSELSKTTSTKALTAADPDPSCRSACRSSCSGIQKSKERERRRGLVFWQKWTNKDATFRRAFKIYLVHGTQKKVTYRSQCRKPRSQQNELDGVKEIGLSASVSSQNAVRCGRKGVDFRLLPEGPEIGDCDLFNVHAFVCLIVFWIATRSSLMDGKSFDRSDSYNAQDLLLLPQSRRNCDGMK